MSRYEEEYAKYLDIAFALEDMENGRSVEEVFSLYPDAMKKAFEYIANNNEDEGIKEVSLGFWRG